MPEIPYPTVGFDSPSMEIEKFTIYTWEKKVCYLHHLHFNFSLTSYLISKNTLCSIIISLAIFLLRDAFSRGFQWLYADTSEVFLKDWNLQINQQVKSRKQTRVVNGRMYLLRFLASTVFLICCSAWWTNWNIFCKCVLLMWMCGLSAAKYSSPL